MGMKNIVTEKINYAKLVSIIGTRENIIINNLCAIIPEKLAEKVKSAALVSIGTDISKEDIKIIQQLCKQVISLCKYRDQLHDYLKKRMNVIAPNLTMLVGEIVGAQLIAHAGTLKNLAKYPSSTVQIFGSEKALFRALKLKKRTPKYGLIYNSSFIVHSPQKIKGKISRVLSAKCSLSIRVDALGNSAETTIGIKGRAKVESRLLQLNEHMVKLNHTKLIKN